MFYDVHTHREVFDDSEIPIRNIIFGLEGLKLELLEDFSKNMVSIGFHPMILGDFSGKKWNELVEFATNKNVVAIGECGLDVRSETSLAEQRRIFKMHIELAVLLQKPLLIHCVRAFGECVHMLRDAPVPVVFHGFNNSWSKAAMLLEQGFFLSFGQSILYHSGLKTVLSRVPLQQVFFETDDAGISVHAVYQEAAKIFGTTLDFLQQQINKNFTNVFL